MLIEVIPFGGSIDDQWLTYFVRDELAEIIKIGCLVEVPFRNALDYAMVTNLSDTWINSTSDISSDNIRSIVRIITTIPLLAPYQIYSIFDISSYYLVHAHHILSLYISKTLIKYLEKQDFRSLLLSTEKKVNNPDPLICFSHHTDVSSFYKAVDENILWRTILVFPDDFAIDAYMRHASLKWDTTLIVHDKLTETKKHKAFFSVYNGEKNIIIWTRRILYYNLSRYDRVVYIEDAINKTVMRFNHTYKHLELLRRLAHYSHLHISIVSSLPSIESMYLLHTWVYRKADRPIIL